VNDLLSIEYKNFVLQPKIKLENDEDRDNLFLLLAMGVCVHSTCVRRMYGILVVKDDVIIGTGYNGNYDGCHRQCTIEGSCLRDLNCVDDNAKFDPCLREELGLNLTSEDLNGTTFYVVCHDRLQGKLLEVGMSRTAINELNDIGVKRFVVGKKCIDMTK
jgi:dCMP deaminase